MIFHRFLPEGESALLSEISLCLENYLKWNVESGVAGFGQVIEQSY